jgi:glycosyltransferase involved in cell wall biosynthesis
MKVVHLLDCPFFGGPERQILGLVKGLRHDLKSTVIFFRNSAAWLPFVEKLKAAGIAAEVLQNDNPNIAGIVSELRGKLRDKQADLLVCHGYKADILGWVAARTLGIPVIAVSRGWTAHTRKVRFNESLDRLFLGWMDAVVCVSEGQAQKVRAAGVSSNRVEVIHNSIDPDRFRSGDFAVKTKLQRFFDSPRDAIVIAVGRLSPEKGFDHLIEAAKDVLCSRPNTGFLIIGEGPERAALESKIKAANLGQEVILAGFRTDVDELMPHADILVQSSHTEGLPNVLLEAGAAGIPVVATNVGGTPEVVQDGVTGLLVPPANATALAGSLIELLNSSQNRVLMGKRAQAAVSANFTFANQCARYRELFGRLARTPSRLTARAS